MSDTPDNKHPRPLTFQQLRDAHALMCSLPPNISQLAALKDERWVVCCLDIPGLKKRREGNPITDPFNIDAYEPAFMHASLTKDEREELRAFLKHQLIEWCTRKVEARKMELKNYGVEIPDDWNS